ncbi:sulfite exporter TauE/SafE family protein [Desulfobulbus oralis]|uniref:Probable membrane transporter protein n=1 Tax=Desulfobulbus oralis TaxID=1986146 RepID=A0A2L1GM94_9BACT|nr:sulfite exporter TauE/SafE family protein [Desulfobulbus oralis]AVD70805.1 permease [Desulfobulbus oralis]
MNRKRLGKGWIMALAMLLVWCGPVRAAEDVPAGEGTVSMQAAADQAGPVTLRIEGDSTLNNGGTIRVQGQAPAGKPVFLEVWADAHQVRASRFDGEPDPKTGVRPYIFYLTERMPAYFKIFVPITMQDKIDAEKKKGRKWSMSNIIKELGAESAFNVPAAAPVRAYQSSFMASVIGSRGQLISDKPNRKVAMQLTKARFRDLDKVVAAQVDLKPNGSFTADIVLRSGIAPGAYKIVAHVDKDSASAPATFTNTIAFPTVYLNNAGTSMNLVYPFLLSLAVTIFGVLMGAGGGFILNPLLVTLFPLLPHTVVAGTVTPTVLFSQGSGIYNYSRINFISWKLGVGIGLAMLAGGFIGPKLTEMISLTQFTFAFGWILLVLAALMLWQTTPGYLAKNKKEQAILKEYKKRAQEAATKK